MTTLTAPISAPAGRLPRQVPYIIGNEACERFSFYGMRNILTAFLVSSLLLYAPESDRAGIAKDVFHSFVIGVYFFPLLGGWLADRFYGKYPVIIWMSLVYCLGHLCLALFDNNRHGFYAGLFLIAFGSGGIKPLVVSFVGDQFDQSNKRLAKIVFDAFYWSINFGSLFASLFIPILLRDYGPSVAFGVPGILMFIATAILYAGRKHYVYVPPAAPNPDSFLRVVRTSLLTARPGENRTGLVIAVLAGVLAVASLSLTFSLGFVPAFCLAIVCVLAGGGIGAWIQLDRARTVHPEQAVEGVRAVLRILIVFALTTPFWSLFDQKASTWVLQADAMTKPSWFLSSQMQALNPLLVLLLIPFNNIVLYPLLRKLGYEPTALRRMGFGIAFAGLAWIAAGTIQLYIDGGDPVTVMWQILPYALLTFGEVLVSATGLEFAYSQAPLSMKGVIMALWYLSITIGNLWVLLANATVRNEVVTSQIAATGLSETAFLMFFFALFALVVALFFALYAKRYPLQDHYRVA